MTDEEAYQILGIKPSATADEIACAYRSLIKKLHPDQGGSTYSRLKSIKLRKYFFVGIADAEVKPGSCSRDSNRGMIKREVHRVPNQTMQLPHRTRVAQLRP